MDHRSCIGRPSLEQNVGEYESIIFSSTNNLTFAMYVSGQTGPKAVHHSIPLDADTYRGFQTSSSIFDVAQ
jgi:hypothetical protein